jgi:CheY-like chemotaxis protein
MLSRSEFSTQVADAYEHLYDLVYLGTHPLTGLIVPATTGGHRENAWKLHQTLLDAIEELDPGPKAPTFSREWRRHRLMALRFVDGLGPEAVASQLAVSRRQYYRMHETAIEAVANVLWNRYVVPSQEISAISTALPQAGGPQESVNRLELLRLEAAQMAQATRYARIDEVVKRALDVLQDWLNQRAITISLAIPDDLPDVAVQRNLLRQMLLAMLGYLTEQAEHTALRMEARAEQAVVRLLAQVDPANCAAPSEAQERLAALDELALLNEVVLQPVTLGAAVVGFEMRLPARARRTVLVVDDNEDVLELFQRYLSMHNYDPVTARTFQEALALAQRLQPFAITLDLMMPDQDGWDLLQALLNRADTQHIPIIVCSVLKQKELALSLGATAFLEKPVSDQVLLSALNALDQRR